MVRAYGDKWFEGKRYAVWTSHQHKSNAVRIAKRLRAMGGKARIVKIGKRWVVYVRNARRGQ